MVSPIEMPPAFSYQPSAISSQFLFPVKVYNYQRLIYWPSGLRALPSTAKAACIADSDGMAEALPFQNSP
jgi:hypothetical protein